MTGELQVLEQKVDSLSANVTGINAELKQVNESLKHLIRIDGNIKRVDEKADRIGKECKDHEARLRALESKPGLFFSSIVKHVVSAGTGAVAVFFVMKVMGA